MEEEIYELMENEAEGFKIDNDNTCDWAIKVIKKETEEIERLIKIADSEIEELQQKKESLRKSLESKTGYLKSKLFEYFGKVEHKETKTQESYKLLSGSLVLKKPTQKMAPDKERLLAYVKENNMPEFVKVKEDIDWAAYKKECQIVDGKVVNVQTGDMLPEDVIAVEDVPGEFDVKI